MKKILMYLCLLALITTSCSGFLDEVDQDKFVPSTTDHYAALLLSECNETPQIMTSVQFMTDEVQESKGKLNNSAYRTQMKPLYTWQKNIERDEEQNLVYNNEAWGGLYKNITITNYVMEQIDDAEGSQAEKDFIKGEAHFYRALSYFCLTNLYAEPYHSEEQARTTLGVPLRTGIGVEPVANKAMLIENYRQIESDLKEAIKLIHNSGLTKSIYHPTELACRLLMSRVKLFTKKYEEAVTEATKVIEESALKKLTIASVEQAFISKSNPELLFSMGESNAGGLFGSTMQNFGFSASDDLIAMYDEEDLRKTLFFNSHVNNGITEYYPRKMDAGYSELGWMNLRAAEAWLNRAESYAYSGNLTEAKSDIRHFLEMRYTTIENVVIPSNQAELIEFIRNERFKEFCFEMDFRWFDLRRMEVEERHEIIHKYTIVDEDGNEGAVETYRLLVNDPNYTLSVPEQEKENNPFIYDYERYDKMPS